MLNLNEFVTFCAIADTGSFSQAAEKLQISKALVSKHLFDLEQSLGVKLMHRTTRKVGLTAAGTVFYERCQQLLQEAGSMVQEIKRFRTSPGGHIKVSSAIMFGRRQLAPLIAEFLRQYPDVSVELTLTDRFADLITEGQDVVIRTAEEPRLLSLVARPLVPWRWVLCASPSYLGQYPMPRAPQDLAEHNCLLYMSNTRGEWRFIDAGGTGTTVRIKGNFKANNADGVLQGALAGLGVAAITTMAAADEIRAGRLVRLLPEYRMPEGVLYASYLPNPTMAQCVQAFVRFLETEFDNQAPWEHGLDFPP